MSEIIGVEIVEDNRGSSTDRNPNSAILARRFESERGRTEPQAIGGEEAETERLGLLDMGETERGERNGGHESEKPRREREKFEILLQCIEETSVCVCTCDVCTKAYVCLCPQPIYWQRLRGISFSIDYYFWSEM